MKKLRFAFLASVLLCPFTQQLSHAETIQYKRKFINVEPLAGSQYAHEHPGKLPYKHCFLESVRGGELNSRTYDFVIWGSNDLGSYTHQLMCFSEKYKLGYKIPLKLDDMQFWGLRATVPIVGINFDFSTSLKVVHLDGKKVSDLFGKYKGFEGSVAAIVGVGGYSLKNENGVGIQGFMGKTEFAGGITADYAQMQVSRRTNFVRDEGNSPLLLVKGTQEPRDPEKPDWYEVDVNIKDPFLSVYDYKINYSELDNLEFEKDT